MRNALAYILLGGFIILNVFQAICGSIPGTVISAKITTGNTANTFGIADPSEMIGGFMQMSSLGERDSIPTERRKVGMEVYVHATRTVYQLYSGTTYWRERPGSTATMQNLSSYYRKSQHSQYSAARADEARTYAVRRGSNTFGNISGLKNFNFDNSTSHKLNVAPTANTVAGKGLSVEAGSSATNTFTPFNALSQTSRSWRGMTVAPNGDVYAATASGDIYKQTGGIGDFIALGQASRNWIGLAAAPNGDVYASINYGDLYKQTGGTGDFIALGQASRNWTPLAAAPNGDIYAAIGLVTTGDIYKQTGGIGDFIALGQTSRNWMGMTVALNGDVYAATTSGDIYKQTGGTGDFIALGQTSRSWRGMTTAPNGDIYAATNFGDIYKQTGGIGNFIALGQTTRYWFGIAADSNGDVYASDASTGDIYKQSQIGTSNLSGGQLTLASGAGKGTGASRISLQTGTTLSSGGTLQAVSEKMSIEGDGTVKILGNLSDGSTVTPVSTIVAHPDLTTTAHGGIPSKDVFDGYTRSALARSNTKASTADLTAHTGSATPYGGHPPAGSNKQVPYNLNGTSAGAAMLNYSAGVTLAKSSNSGSALEVIGTALERAVLFVVRDCQGASVYELDSTGCATFLSNPRFGAGLVVLSKPVTYNYTTISRTPSINVRFLKPVLTLTTSNFRLRNYTTVTGIIGSAIPRSIFVSTTSMTITPSSPLQANRWYYVLIQNVRNICGTIMSDVSWIFRTGS